MVAANYGFSHFASGNIAISYNRPNTSWRFSYNAKYEDDVINSTLNRKVHHTGYEVFQQMQSIVTPSTTTSHSVLTSVSTLATD